jgi:hypothetical protein
MTGRSRRPRDARLDLGARDRQLVADPLQLPALEHEGRLAAGGLDARTHLGERFGDPIHRTPPERVVACQLEAPLLPGEEAGEETQGRAGVAAVDRAWRLAQAAKANSVDANRVHVVLVDGHPAATAIVASVSASAETADGRLALANGRSPRGGIDLSPGTAAWPTTPPQLDLLDPQNRRDDDA